MVVSNVDVVFAAVVFTVDKENIVDCFDLV